ncbi:STAS-like domain-containing protein [Clostridium hydrogeniformans]|uniref:STAS-like domain-containing protein n=1 Tax=Clostridium hydrogeniformans TaxID=349933 RepID=UPI0004887B9A|nr:STAS-like domain-containing protein [Clostridium hydrogeniformans]
MEVLVKSVIGIDFDSEDAIVLREFLRDLLNEETRDEVILDFSDIDRVPTTFFCSLLTDLINTKGRDYIINKLGVKNLSNSRDYRRVLLGTAF